MRVRREAVFIGVILCTALLFVAMIVSLSQTHSERCHRLFGRARTWSDTVVVATAGDCGDIIDAPGR